MIPQGTGGTRPIESTIPKISVILPAFNAAGTIERAVRSILDQTLRDLELIVIDDGSTDATADVVRNIGDPRLRLVEFRHRGVAATANTGAELAVASCIARMDADDVSHSTRLEKQWQLLQKQELDVVGCQVRILDDTGLPTTTMRRYERWINEETIESEQIAALRFVELPLVNPSILAKRSYFELGCRENEFPEDYDLMLRAAEQGMRFGKVAEVLLDWNDRSDRLTRTDDRYSTDAFMGCRRTHFLAGPLEGVESVDLWGIGQTGKPWLRWLQGQQITVRRGYEVNTRKVGQQIHGVTIQHPEELPTADGTPLVIAVGAEPARRLIQPHIESRGYVSGKEAWFVA